MPLKKTESPSVISLSILCRWLFLLLLDEALSAGRKVLSICTQPEQPICVTPSEDGKWSLFVYGEVPSLVIPSLFHSETNIYLFWISNLKQIGRLFSVVPCLFVFPPTQAGFCHKCATLKEWLLKYLLQFYFVRLWHLQDPSSQGLMHGTYIRS